MSKCECGHDYWDHELIDEDWDGNRVFGRCEIKGCPCEQYEDESDE
jgi:hypothetical protein